jgi:transcription initiation factor TFIIF subunit alpha
VLTAGPAIQQQQQQVEAKSQTPKDVPPRLVVPPTPAPEPQPVSPTLSPGHGGHSVVARRATSPKMPKPKATITSRGNSPLSSQTSPLAGSRATSPATADSPNGTATLNPKSVLKRKADDSGADHTAANAVNDHHKAKKRKAPVIDVTPIEVSSEELERLLVEWLKNTTGATTKDCIKHFGPYIAEKRPEFASMVRKVAQLKNGVLICKSRGASAPSPVA